MQKKATLFACFIILSVVSGFSQSASTHETVLLTREEYSLNSLLTKQENVNNLSNNRSNVISSIPECVPPAKVEVTSLGADNFDVTWKGPDAVPGGVNYLFRYRPMGEKMQWQEIQIENGHSISLEGLDNFKEYEIEVSKICPPEGDAPELNSKWVNISPIRLPSYRSISLPPFICSDSVSHAPCSGPPYVYSGPGWDTLHINGFPILVDTMWSEPNYEGLLAWYGQGWMPIPFGEAVVRVEWGHFVESVHIDQYGYICTGEVRGVSDDPVYYPDLTPTQGAAGGQICVPPPSSPGFDSSGIHNITNQPWNENGFGPNGTYDQQPPYPGYQPGDPIDTTGLYDPWGFDADGNHWETGTLENPYGCTQEQLNAQPQPPPCDSLPPPYYWVDTTGIAPSQAGIALANEVADSIQLWLEQILTDLENEYQDSINLKGQACENIRTSMNTKVAALGYDEKYLFGPDKEFFNEGMHKRFIAPPKPLEDEIQRDPNQEALEKEHIDLYYCDRDLYIFIDLKEIFGDLKTTGINDLVADMKYLIERFSESEAALYSNLDSLYNWLTIQVKLSSNDKYHELFGLSTPENSRNTQNGIAVGPDQFEKARNPIHNPGNLIAAGPDNGMLNEVLLQALVVTREDINFQFKQGWKVINGTHRACFLEAIEHARTQKLFNNLLLTEHDSTLMPIVVKNRANDGRVYKVYLDNIVVSTYDATLDAFVVLELPHNGQKIVFESYGVRFTTTGPVAYPLRLELGNDVDVRLSNAAKLTLKGGTGNTFVSVNCNGYAGLGLEAEVEICRDKVVPLDEQTLEVLPEPERMNGTFQMFIPSWGDFFLQLTMDPFAVTGIEDVKWQIDTVVLDFSDVTSPAGSPPQGYESAFAGPNGFDNAWKGFYIKNLSVSLPKQWTQDSTGALSIGAQDVVIDNMGFSGHVLASPVLSIDDGNAGGWAFSIDEFGLTVLANNLENVFLDGLVHIPIISNANNCNTGPPTAADCFPYYAYLEHGGIYHFDISMPSDSFCVDMWKAGRLNLAENTRLKMAYAGGDFDMRAYLYGSIEINGDAGNGISFNIPEISFESVEVSNKAPYFSPGTWKFPSGVDVDFGGFGMSIQELGMIQSDPDTGGPALKVGAAIRLSIDSIGLAAEGGFRIAGELVEYNGRQRWKYKSVKVDDICLTNKSFAGVPFINGCLSFYEQDSIYGSGFRGGVSVRFEKLNQVGISAVAQFGKVNGFRYFFVDALACATIPISPGINLQGIGGGVYHRMSRPGSAPGLPACTGGTQIPPGIGTSLSGITYTPADTVGLGLKATVAMSVVKDNAFNANATFEANFNSGGGIGNLYFYGNGRLMSPMDLQGVPAYTPEELPGNGAALSANVDMHLDFNNDVFHGNLETYLNTPGDFLSGRGPNGSLGRAEVHFSQSSWYIKVGRPNARLGVSLRIPGLGTTLADVGTYLQIGKNGIDPMPPLPQSILAVIPNASDPFSIPDNRSALTASGTGFIFGANLNVQPLDLEFLMFYASLGAEMGFDVSVLDYGPNAVCAGSGEQIGINGWYAQGQLYARIHGDIGLRAKVFGNWRDFHILDIGAAAALQARLPNPFWAEGTVGGRFSVMGGLIKGQCDFQFTVGEKCEILGADNPIAELQLILETTPVDGLAAVPVDTDPTATFTFPIGEAFTLPEIEEDVYYKPILDHAKILYRDYEIPVQEKWNAEKNFLTLVPRYFLPANDTFVLDVQVHIDSSGQNIHSEHRIITFTTGEGIDHIPAANVEGSYPFDGQFNFYKQQLTDNRGYIQLYKGQPDLFYEDEDYDLYVRFQEQNYGGKFHLDVDYDALENKISFGIPHPLFDAGKMYRMQLVKVPAYSPVYGNGPGGANGSATIEPVNMNLLGLAPPALNLENGPIATNVSASTPVVPVNSQGGTSLNGGEAEGTQPAPEQVLFEAYFRVSNYNTFGDKIGYWMNNKVTVPGTQKVIINEAVMEPFDAFELNGYNGGPPLISIDAAHLHHNDWYKNQIEPAVYANFPDCHQNSTAGASICLDNREVAPYGLPPFRGLAFKEPGNALPDYTIKKSWWTAGYLPAALTGTRPVRLIYNLPFRFTADYNDFRSDAKSYIDELFLNEPELFLQSECEDLTPCQCINTHPVIVSAVPQAVRDLYCGSANLPQAPNGTYDVLVKYHLPAASAKSYNNVSVLKE